MISQGKHFIIQNYEISTPLTIVIIDYCVSKHRKKFNTVVCFIPVFFAKHSRDLTRLKLRPAKIFVKKHKTETYVNIVPLCIVIDWRSMLEKNLLIFVFKCLRIPILKKCYAKLDYCRPS